MELIELCWGYLNHVTSAGSFKNRTVISETWTMTVSEEGLLKRRKRKVLGKMFEAKEESEEWKLRKKMDPFEYPNIVSEVKSKRLGHLERMVLKTGWYRRCTIQVVED